jgi:hypothetical protein
MFAVRRFLPALLIAAAFASGCAGGMPDGGPLTATSTTVTAAGEYHPVDLDGVEHLTIENGKLVLHGASRSVTVDLPPAADPEQRNRGWALVTEGESDEARTLTFTQETSLEDFTIAVPTGDGQVAYGSLGARDGGDFLLFAYGTAPKAYWGYVRITKKAA